MTIPQQLGTEANMSAIKELIDAVQGTPIIRFDGLAQAATVELAALEADSKRLEKIVAINSEDEMYPYDTMQLQRFLDDDGNLTSEWGYQIMTRKTMEVIRNGARGFATWRDALDAGFIDIDAAMSRDADEPQAVTDE